MSQTIHSQDKIAMIVEGWSAAVCNIISIMTFLSLECHTVICFGSQHLGIIFDTNNWFLVFPLPWEIILFPGYKGFDLGGFVRPYTGEMTDG